MEKETNQDKTELLPPDTFDDFLGDGFGLPYVSSNTFHDGERAQRHRGS